MKNAVIVSAVRTPVGKRGGVYKTLQRLDLTTPVVKEALRRANITSDMVEENIWGNIPQYLTPSRYVWLSADGDIDTACLTVNRGCGTGLAAMTTAGALIQGGFGEIYTCGGVEQDSRPFMYLHNDHPYDGGVPYMNSLYSSPVEKYGNPDMVQTAENIAAKLGITREECDQYALRSQQLAAKGYEEGLYQEHIVPITVPQKKGDPVVVTQDEMFRPTTTLEGLAKLRPVKGGVCTAGNSSPLNDGASCAVMMEEEKARELGLKPLMRFVDYAVTGIDPRYMGLGPVEAMRRLMKRNKMEFSDLDFIECNEAFASQTLGVIRELNLDIDKVNIRGGGIALGHPYSATGINLAAKAGGIFKRMGGERCAITFCVGGGQGIAALFENCD